ncbi:Oxidoreductase family, NAD-binding Rossmann fold [Parapedobacter luteus]|uniref:Oxidoreductase family, NAD-binding Rossmann fold n=1 Tax=Parapedobacter luteus TaxID=623280 RepID=A0A1T5AGI5_9SPHI|nr:Gfo/Idh/MocA family oxidoreductase [Parapedobacter luteus]SKB33867.1 Oxidoreductase family, NAD-binding Rossmann fold [Parapedobacter luteus]
MNNSRRRFLKQAMLASAAAAVAPNLLMARPRFAAANERVNLACIGIGNRGGEIIRDLYATGLANIVALCDVDMGAPHTQNVLKQFPNVPRFQDFRQLFDKMGNEIDAVSIGVPDHSHFPITMHAMALGKHVYVEKPMARTFNEVELMMKAAEKYNKVVTQMGNQGHSEANYFQFKAWVDAGIIKDVTAITAHMNSPRRWHGWDPNIKSFPPAEPIPDTLDWDLWHSAIADQHDYNKDFINGQWRCWYDFGMGALGDWGAHIIDTAHQFLDLGLPYEVECTKATGHNDFFFPMSSTIVFKFPKRKRMPALDITWYDGLDNLPPIPEGYGVSGLDPNIPPPSTGELEPVKLNPGKIIYGKELTFKGGSHGSTLSIIPEEKAKEMASQLPEVPQSPSNHFANFLKACKGEEETRSPFSVAGPLSQVFSLGVLAQKLNTKLEFDRKKKVITNNELANQLLVGPPPRKGWEQYYQV